MLIEVNIDFLIFELPHFVVKQDQNSRVRELSIRSRTILTDTIFKPIYKNNAYKKCGEKSKKILSSLNM